MLLSLKKKQRREKKVRSESKEKKTKIDGKKMLNRGVRSSALVTNFAAV